MSGNDLQPLMEVRNLTRKTSEGAALLAAVRLQLSAGDRYVLRAASGAGKSVLLRSLAALDPAEGEWYLDGQAVLPQELPHFRTRVLYVAQRPAFPEGSVADALGEPFSWRVHRERSFDEEAVRQWLVRWGRGPEFLKRRTETLSGGEAGGVAVLRALLLEPRVLLLDEPTAGMDDDSTARLEQLVADWFQMSERRAYIWVTHDSAQARRVAERTLRLEQGDLLEDA